MIDLLKFERPGQYPQDEILNEKDRLVRSWVSVEVTDKQGDIVPIKEMKRVLNTWFKRGATMIDQHSNRPIGRGLRWQEANHPETGKPGVIIDYQVFDDYTVDNEVWEDIKTGKRTGLSIGGRATGQPEVKMDAFTKEPGNYLSGLELYEISPVDSPANQFGKNIAINYLAKADKEASPEELAKKLMKDLSKGFMVKNVDEPFAGFKNIDECMQAQMERGHTEDSAKRIANFLMHQTNKEWAEDSKVKPKTTLKEKIPGGLSAGKNPEDFDIDELNEGIRVEMEHTDDPEMAQEIAMDHLTEDPNYYSKLKLIEKCDQALTKRAKNGGKNMGQIKKRRVYLKPGEQAPEGVKVQEGAHGGKFYETGGSSGKEPGEGKTPGSEGEVPQEMGKLPDFSAWGYDSSSDQEYEDMQGNPIGVGDRVKIHPELTHDPAGKKGEEGTLVGIGENDSILVQFDDGKYGAYMNDAVTNTAMERPEAGDAPGSDADLNNLRETNRSAYDALLMAEASHVDVNELADTYYASQLREAAKHTDQEEVQQKLEEAAKKSEADEQDSEARHLSEAQAPWADHAQYSADAEAEGYTQGTPEWNAYMQERANGGTHEDGLIAVHEDYVDRHGEPFSELENDIVAITSDLRDIYDEVPTSDLQGITMAYARKLGFENNNHVMEASDYMIEFAQGDIDMNEMTEKILAMMEAAGIKKKAITKKDIAKSIMLKNIILKRAKLRKALQKDVKKHAWPKEFVKALLHPSSTTKSATWPAGFVKACKETNNSRSKGQREKSGTGGNSK